MRDEAPTILSAKGNAPAVELGNAPCNKLNAGAETRPSAPAISSRDWMIEQARTVHRICSFMQARLDRGERLESVIRLFAWRWQNKTCRCDPMRKLHLSRPSLIRHLYRWRSGGRTPEAVKLRYCNSSRIPKSERARAFLEAAAQPDVFTFHAAFSRISQPGRGLDSFYRCLPTSGREVLAAVFRARREAASAERRISRYLAEIDVFQCK